MKGERHEQRDDEVDAKFSFVNHKTHCEPPSCLEHLLNHTDITDIYLHSI